MIPVETIPGMGGRYKYDIFVKTFVNATMYPHPVQQ
jgi:hypothetical protein